uniref:Uncharacterized protein LOC102809040 n=1 Tax=Saccoglossus kowalevskii TaxID=10224 RepID=A0ABM0MA70_SACKO|nr:PREDICTED: uncharacterized protein LOC102809040 [Saccoglossus kowalevskii]
MSIIAGIYNPEDDCLPSENSTVTAEKMKQSKVRQDASPSAASNKEVAFVPPNVMETDAATASSGVRDISGDRVNDKNSLPVTVFKTVEVVTENDHQSNVENDDYSMCSQEMTRPDALCNGDGFQTKEQMAFLEIMQLTTSTQPTTTSTSNLSISNPNVTVQNLPTVTLSTLNRVENSCYMSLPSSHTGDDEVSVIQELHANVPPIVHTMKESTRVNQQQSLSQNDRLNQTQITVDDDDNDLFLSPFTMTPEK